MCRCKSCFSFTCPQAHGNDSKASNSSPNVVSVSSPGELGLTGLAIHEARTDRSKAHALVSYYCILTFNKCTVHVYTYVCRVTQ